jgi:hypothetical protein
MPVEMNGSPCVLQRKARQFGVEDDSKSTVLDIIGSTGHPSHDRRAVCFAEKPDGFQA